VKGDAWSEIQSRNEKSRRGIPGRGGRVTLFSKDLGDGLARVCSIDEELEKKKGGNLSHEWKERLGFL